MTIEQLLPIAASLAPNLVWYVPDDRMHRTGMIYMIGGAPLYDPEEPEYQALILYAVLRECERRGWECGVGCDPEHPGEWTGMVAHDGVETPRVEYKQATDPAFAILSAFVSLLEAEQEVKA